MSSRTPKLDLVLPVGGEHVSRAIINENNTKIDAGYGTLSEQKAYAIKVTSTDTWSTLYTKLMSIPVSETATIYFNGSAFSMLTDGAYASDAFGTVYRLSSTHYRYNLQCGNNIPLLIDQNGASSSSIGTLNIYDINSKIANLINVLANISISANSYTEVDYPTGFNRSNTMILGFKIAYYYIDYSNFSVELTTSKIKIYNNSSQNWQGVTIAMYKVS